MWRDRGNGALFRTSYAEASSEYAVLERRYDLDPRGNRTGSSGVKDLDDGGNNIFDYSYTASDDTNQYTAVDGLSYTFDAIEQMTYDPSKGLYFAYDYKGQLILEDDDSNFSAPERRYGYDNQGRKRYEGRFYEASYHLMASFCYGYGPVCPGGCGGSPGPQVWDYISLDDSDELIGLITFDYGAGAHGSLSGNAVHPATAAVLPGGSTHGPTKVRETIHEDENYVSRYRYEDQLGSLSSGSGASLRCGPSRTGVADAGGAKVDEYRNLEYGSVIHRPIAFDGAAALVSSATHDEPAAGTSEIVLDDDYLDGIDLTGKELVVSIPNDPNDAYRVARVVRNTANTLWINDPGTYSAGDAIDAGRPFVVYDFEGSVQEASVDFAVSSTNYPGSPDETEVQCDAYEHALGWSAVGETGGAIVIGAISGYAYIFPGDQTENFLVTVTYQVTPPGHSVTKGTGGEWTGSPTFEANGGGAADDRTKFTDSGADFQAYMVGWLLQPDVELPSYLEIVEVDESSGNWVRVKGDADTLATSGSTYRLHAPPGVDRATGALITDLEEAGSHWLWAGYEYVPPMVGFADPAGQDPGIYGAQSGGNKLGSYHCWNRVYEPATGRWTTPGPAMTPWANLWEYAGSAPSHNTDPSGLNAAAAAGGGAAAVTLAQAIRMALAAAAIWCLLDSDCRQAVVDAAKVAWEAAKELVKPKPVPAPPKPCPLPDAKPQPAPAPVPYVEPKPSAGPRPIPPPNPGRRYPVPVPDWNPQPDPWPLPDGKPNPVPKGEEKERRKGEGCTCEEAEALCNNSFVGGTSAAQCAKCKEECIRNRNTNQCPRGLGLSCWPEGAKVVGDLYCPSMKQNCPRGVH